MDLEDVKIPEKDLYWSASISNDVSVIIEAFLKHEMKIDLTTVPPADKEVKKSGPEVYIPLRTKGKRWPIIRLNEEGYDMSREYFWTLGFNNEGHLAFIDLVAIGGEWNVKLKVKEVFRGFNYYDASQVVFVHNHPCEKADLVFSTADISSTQKLIQASLFLELKVRNHILLSGGECTSMEEQGIMKRLLDFAMLKNKGEEKLTKLLKAEKDRAEEQQRVITLTSQENTQLKEEALLQSKVIGQLSEVLTIKDQALEGLNEEITLKEQILEKQNEEIARLKEELAKAKKS
ncbi:MAG: hypothetical protein FWE37_04845 [Spirochaetaceae bacterium]|nr:hypothetical protein [Spirochaetaceae bacterium]